MKYLSKEGLGYLITKFKSIFATKEEIENLYTLGNWTHVPLLNGWTQTTTPLRYYKNPFGEVRVVGQITGGTASLNTVVGTLPEGYRPAFLNRGVFTKINDGSIVPHSLQPNGDIVITGVTTTGVFAFNFSFRT